jgi:hypothetical protein
LWVIFALLDPDPIRIRIRIRIRNPADRSALISVLAVHLKRSESKMVRQTIYSHFNEILREPKDLFMFLDLHHKIKGGWGAGLRRQLAGWYEQQAGGMAY